MNYPWIWVQCCILCQGSLLTGKDKGLGDTDSFSETSNQELTWEYPNWALLAAFPFPPMLLIARFAVLTA